MSWTWTKTQLLSLARSYQGPAAMLAAADLGVFDALADGPLTAGELARRVSGDERAITILADALATIPLLTKDGDLYALPPGLVGLLTETGPDSCLAMVRHQANCMRAWAQLALAVRTGEPVERTSIPRGDGELATFMAAMDQFCRGEAPGVVDALGPPEFTHLLDVGGGLGTWTIALLSASTDATATLFDRPDVMPLARERLAAAGVADRVTLVGGDFTRDEPLPAGADLAWLSAVAHMGSRDANHRLFAKIHAALVPGGQLLLRDIVMAESRTAPAAGAMFAVNMLVHCPGGGTYTFDEFADDMRSAGFVDPTHLHRARSAYSVIGAHKAMP